MKKIRITLVRSLIDEPAIHRKTIQALGLRRLHHTVEKNYTPQIEGMIKSVHHLVRTEEIESQPKKSSKQ